MHFAATCRQQRSTQSSKHAVPNNKFDNKRLHHYIVVTFCCEGKEVIEHVILEDRVRLCKLFRRAALFVFLINPSVVQDVFLIETSYSVYT